MMQLPELHPRTVRPTERSPRAQNPDARSRGSRDNAVRLRSVEPACVPLRHAAPSPPRVLDSLHRLAKAQSRPPPDFLSGHAYQDGSERIEATLRRRRVLFAGFVARMEDTRLPNRSAWCSEKWWEARAVAAAQDEGEWRRTAEQGAEHFMAKWIATEKANAGLRHAVVCPNVTRRTKERIAQSKRARGGSLALVD